MESNRFFDERLNDASEFYDECLLRIKKIDWQPSQSQLSLFVKECYDWMREKYEQLEITQNYFLTTHLLRAKDSITGKELCFLVEEGFTASESSATHATGWELDNLVKQFNIDKNPIDFEFYVFGKRERSF